MSIIISISVIIRLTSKTAPRPRRFPTEQRGPAGSVTIVIISMIVIVASNSYNDNVV